MPQGRSWWLRLRLLSALSHHDPAQADKSNRLLFRRQAQLATEAPGGRKPTQEEIDAICQRLPVPTDAAPLFAEATLEQFIAAALVREFIRAYGSGDGAGIFEGAERYRRLEDRITQAATQASTLFTFWGTLCDALQVGAPAHGESESLARILALPSVLGSRVLRTLAQHARPCVMLGRLWAEQEKHQSASYAAKAGVEQAAEGTVTLSFDVSRLDGQSAPPTIQVPSVSANSVRHELVREPGMWHLFDRLGIEWDAPNMPAAALFYNGGDLKEGATAPSNAFWLTQEVKRIHPLLALISGTTNEMVLGEGNLRVFAWVRCRENNDALKRAGLDTDISVFDLLDEETLTRHAGRVGKGQMPFSFETLAKGTEIVVELAPTVYADELQIGALMAAVKTYAEADATIAGQSARGFGRTDLTWHTDPDEDALLAYETYLDANAEALRAGIIDGTFGTGRQLVYV